MDMDFGFIPNSQKICLVTSRARCVHLNTKSHVPEGGSLLLVNRVLEREGISTHFYDSVFLAFKMNPNAKSFSFNPAAQGFVPPQVAAQQQRQGGVQPEAEGAGAYPSYSNYQQGYSQGDVGGYYGAQQSSAPQSYGAHDGSSPYGAGGFPQYNGPPQQDARALPPRPPVGGEEPNRKPVVMSLGSKPEQTEAKKPVNISLGAGPKKNDGADSADKKPVNISIGAGSTKKNTAAPDTNTPSTLATNEGLAKAKEQSDSREASPAPVTSVPNAGQAAKKAAKIDAKVEKSQTDANKILEEANKVSDAETMRDLFGDKLDDLKSHLNIVFIGHVDAGKSTMGGNLLFLTGMVDKRTMEKYEREAKEAGRESWYLSWALDSTPQEREKGKTVEVGRAYFETGKRRYTILDAPGHKTYVPSMISGASQADVACLVISARRGEFETGFEKGGQTREHAMLVKTAGVQRLIVVVNKMDDPTVLWDEGRYNEIITKLTPFLKGTGFNPKTDITFIPVSAYSGENLKEKVTKERCPWYNGPTLLGFLDDLSLGDRKISEPVKMPISEKYSDMGTIVVGKLESGKLRKGDNLLLMPNRSTVEVTAIYNETEDEVVAAISGDNVRVKLKGVDSEDVSVGFVLTDPKKPVNVVTRFEAQLAILESRNIIAAGYSAVMHVHTVSEEISLQALLHYYDKKTGKKSRKPPQFAKKGKYHVFKPISA